MEPALHPDLLAGIDAEAKGWADPGLAMGRAYLQMADRGLIDRTVPGAVDFV